MRSPEYFRTLAGYHVWAHTRLLKTLEPVTDDQYHGNQGLFFHKSSCAREIEDVDATFSRCRFVKGNTRGIGLYDFANIRRNRAQNFA